MHGSPIGPACHTCGPARETSISGIFNPWQIDFVPAMQSSPGGTPLTNSSEASEFQGYQAFAMDPLRSMYRMQLDIRPMASILYPAGAAAPSASQIAGGVRYCPTRMRIKWNERGGAVQEIDVSIGAGISFGVPPTNYVQAFWLIPNPRTNNDVIVPTNFDRNATKFATTASAIAVVADSPSPTRATLTQMVFVTTDQGVVGHQVLLPRGARSLQIFSSPAFGNVPVPAAPDVEAFFVQEYTRLPFGVAPAPPEDTFPTQVIPFADPFETPRVIVPAGFSAVRLRANAGVGGIARNVTLVWELDV